jgi:outer membrane lipopolysaccharide assembly protein LptE/RlpB
LKGDADSLLEVDVHVRQAERLSLDSDFLKVVRSPRTRPDQLMASTKPQRAMTLEMQHQMEQQQQ